MKVLVTGAAGFVGAHLTERLTSAGHEVVRTSVAPGQNPAMHHLDVTDADGVSRFFARTAPTAVIHLAARASIPMSWEAPQATYRVNLFGTVNVLQALRDTDTRVLLVGSGQQYQPPDPPRAISEEDPMVPTNPYAASKIAAEEAGLMFHRHLGMHVMSARSFNHTGPGQSGEYAVGTFSSQIAAILRGESERVIKVGNLASRRDLTDVRDVVEAYRLLIETGEPGEAYNVCSGTHVSMREVLDLLLQEAGLYGDVEVDEDPDARAGDIPVLFGSPSKIAKAVGWEAKIPLAESLRDTLHWKIDKASAEAR